MVFMPPVIGVLMKQAPEANVRTVYLPPVQIEQAMETGDVDLAVGYFPDLQKAGTYQQQLFTSDFVCMARSNNPYIGSRLTLAAFLKAPHAAVRAAGRSQELFEKALTRSKLTRRVLLTVPHFLSLLEIIPKTDLIATVPRVVADSLSRAADIKAYPLPVSTPTLPVKQFWHKRYHKDPANQWIRTVVRDLFQRK
jgi:DNA-binding transcriptional LysR family regulator